MNLSSKDGVSSPEYEAFVDKFKPKLTTDDCYTPPEVYEVIRDWVLTEYNLGDVQIVRPFWPGGNYEQFDYPDGCLVLDNPPFSILTKICRYYLDRGIRFFLFAPSLTCLCGSSVATRMNHIVCDSNIIYENGANVRTAFVTNLGDPNIVMQTEPELGRRINAAVAALREQTTRQLPKYEYPSHILTAAMAQNYAKYGIRISVRRSDCVKVSSLESQKEHKKTIFGGGLLLSDTAAEANERARIAMEERARIAMEERARIAMEERARATKWALSDRERAIVEQLNQDGEV